MDVQRTCLQPQLKAKDVGRPRVELAEGTQVLRAPRQLRGGGRGLNSSFVGSMLYVCGHVLMHTCLYLLWYTSIQLFCYLSVCLSISLSIYVSIFPSIHPSIYPSIHLCHASIYPSIHPSIHLSIYLGLNMMFVSPSACLLPQSLF